MPLDRRVTGVRDAERAINFTTTAGDCWIARDSKCMLLIRAGYSYGGSESLDSYLAEIHYSAFDEPVDMQAPDDDEG